MTILRLVLLGAACLVQEALSAGFYTVVAPRVLRPNSEYHVAITTQDTSQPTTVTVAVSGKQHAGGMFEASQTVSVEPYITHIVKLEIGDLGPGMYNLTARGVNGLDFVNSTVLNYVHKSHSVFIQTDKAVYKPGHKIQFRAIVLDAHLKPSVTGALDVYITDGKGNRVKQWSRALTTKGVFSGELQLPQSPVLGDWNITVVVMDQYFYKTFQVAEYVLPKFEVTVDAPAHATFKDSHLVATIHAKYTYGKAVRGEATITLYPTYYSGLLQPIFQNPVRKVIPIDGKANVEFDITKDLQLGDEYERSVQIDVTVEEALTGRRQNTSFEVMLHKYKYKMELIKTSEYFKPGLKYTAFIKLTYHDGTPVQDTNNPVTVRHGYSYDSTLYTEEKQKLSKHGMVMLDFYPPLENATVLALEAEYLDLKEWFSAVSAAMSPSNTYIQAVINTENPVVNKDIELQINSTEPMKYFSYQVLGRGDVVMASTIQVSNNNTHKFRFVATYVMAPTAHVVVFYVKDDGEVVADAIDIELQGSLQNFVKINTNSEETQPGTDVELTVETKPNSYVGILGVDQSVLLLKSGNDITEDAVLEELGSYDSSSQAPYMPSLTFRSKRPYYWWPGSATAQQVFDNSGAVILTNGLVHENSPWLYYRGYAFAEDGVSLRSGGAPVFPMSTAAFPMKKESMAPTEPEIRVRRIFPETWLWQMLETGFDGKTTVRKQVPDTITSWVISGFSLDSLFGLGLSETPRKLRVFRPFFLSLDLPYSVIRGEIVAIPIVVFNYMNKDLEVDVTLENEQLENFEFAEVTNEVSAQPKLELYRRKRVSVKANSGSSLSFMITPKKLGHITIKVTASSPVAGDSVVKKLLVKPEGETQYYNKAVFADLRNKQPFQTTVNLDIPQNIVAGSEMVEVSAVGDVLGPSIPNLANLIKMPFGCGEQNMLNFVPNIVVIEYLKNTNQLTQVIESKALRYMETGYQQELTYRHPDGSFSAFGSSDPSGSTWLTAFVAKSFQQAVPFINVEEKVIQEALHWLSTNQASNGSFPEVGKVSHRDMQGGAAKGLALTAYTLIAFLENQNSNQLYRNTINKAVDYIVRNLEGLDDIYALAVSSYALNLAQHSAKDAVFNLFEIKAQTSGDMKWWSKPIGMDDKKNPWYGLPNSVDVEMTAYGLLIYLQRGLVQEALPIMKWLITQRNEQGGFASTQDTVIGLQALAKLAERISSSDVDISVVFSYSGGSPTKMKVNKANAMILQKQELPGKVRKLDIQASGSGFAVVQVSYHYNLNVTGAWPLFTLNPQVDKNSDRNHLQLSICSGFVGTQATNESNMAVMEVTLPSGFTVDADALPSLRTSQNVKRVETKNGDTVVVLYFDKMTRQEYCPTVSAFRTHKVAKQKPVPVTIYDYYDSSRRARAFYEPRVSTLCDICEGEDCNTACSSKPHSRSHENQSSAAARVLLSCAYLILCAVFFEGWVL